MAQSDAHALLLDIGARLTSLEKSVDKAVDKVKTGSKKMTDAGTSLERFFERPNLGKALDKTFDATRFKVLDSGVARVGLFGSALENLGAGGLAAAAGIGAFALAMTKAQEAVNFADELDDTSAKLKIGVEDLQAYRHAFGQVGIEVQAGQQGLQALNAALGAVNQNLPRSARTAKIFDVLGISRDQLRNYQDAAQLLPKVAEGFQHLDTAAQAAVAKSLGIESLLPLLREGANGISRLTAEARELGIVMDASLVKQGADAADKLKTLDEIMRTKTNVAFAAYAETLIDIKKAFLGATTAGLAFLAAITGKTPAMEKIASLKLGIASQADTPTGRANRAHYQAELDQLLLQERLADPKFQSARPALHVRQAGRSSCRGRRRRRPRPRRQGPRLHAGRADRQERPVRLPEPPGRRSHAGASGHDGEPRGSADLAP
jgi:hypothetical protein